MGNGVIKDLGPCSVTYGDDLGTTLGGVIFRYTEESRPVNEDQKGVTNVDEIKVGASCEAEVPLSRSSLGILATVIGGSSYTGTKLKVKNQVGISMYDNAQELILKPIIDNVPSSDEKTWLRIPKAYPRMDAEIVYNNEGQRVYKVIFKGFPDADTGLMWQIG